ncbi:MAG: hypothetical protein HY303_04500 [Candidatus Wallbacteria bacterium]|nr:hypothetical protein [Candidatus Wallbacteria bacterium]
MSRCLLVISMALVLLCAQGRAAEPFGPFNLRTGLFRRLFRPFAERAKPTRYPIVLAHGICGFDKVTWGPIELLFTSDVPATGSIEARAEQLAKEIRQRWPEGKVNILCHSMGGLDARYMIAKLGMGDRVATVTQVGTPNHGTLLSDWFVYYARRGYVSVERLARALGIDLTGFHDLSVAHMEREFNPAVQDDPRVSYRSFAGSQRLRNYFLPLMATHALNRSLEKTLLRQQLEPSDRAALRALQAGDPQLAYALSQKGFQDVLRDLPSAWLQPALAGRTDGLVGMSSARHGQYLGDLDADHLDEMGWLTTFDAKGFYEAVAAHLADEGY